MSTTTERQRKFREKQSKSGKVQVSLYLSKDALSELDSRPGQRSEVVEQWLLSKEGVTGNGSTGGGPVMDSEGLHYGMRFKPAPITRETQPYESVRKVVRENIPKGCWGRVEQWLMAQVDSFHDQLTEAVDARLAEQKKYYKEAKAEADEQEERYRNLVQHHMTIMTMDEYKTVLGCLHPDRADRSPDKLHKAFNIFQRIRRTVDKDTPIATLRKFGWEGVAPYWKRRRQDMKREMGD